VWLSGAVALAQVCSRAGIKLPPHVYKVNLDNDSLEAALEGMLAEQGLSADSDERDIKVAALPLLLLPGPGLWLRTGLPAEQAAGRMATQQTSRPPPPARRGPRSPLGCLLHLHLRLRPPPAPPALPTSPPLPSCLPQRVKSKLETRRDLDGIDGSNIISGSPSVGRRPRRAAAAAVTFKFEDPLAGLSDEEEEEQEEEQEEEGSGSEGSSEAEDSEEEGRPAKKQPGKAKAAVKTGGSKPAARKVGGQRVCSLRMVVGLRSRARRPVVAPAARWPAAAPLPRSLGAPGPPLGAWPRPGAWRQGPQAGAQARPEAARWRPQAAYDSEGGSDDEPEYEESEEEEAKPKRGGKGRKKAASDSEDYEESD
jgi:hypothetical protein